MLGGRNSPAPESVACFFNDTNRTPARGRFGRVSLPSGLQPTLSGLTWGQNQHFAAVPLGRLSISIQHSNDDDDDDDDD